ncbi:MAG: hypothetical protein ACLSIL_19760 [Enterococcus casseliflavus]
MKKIELGFESLKGIFLFVAAYQVYQAFNQATIWLTNGGYRIAQIESKGGATLEEAYYQNLDTIYAGFGHLAKALGLAITLYCALLEVSSLFSRVIKIYNGNTKDKTKRYWRP